MSEDSKKIVIRVPISFQNDSFRDKVLIFGVEDIKELRYRYGIVGTLLGTLPSVKQQNTFLSVPLQINMEEALWLVCELKVCVFEFPAFFEFQMDNKNMETTNFLQRDRLLEDLQIQYEIRKQQNRERAIRLGGVTKEISETKEYPDNWKDSLFVNTLTISETHDSIYRDQTILEGTSKYDMLLEKLMKRYYNDFRVYTDLKKSMNLLVDDKEEEEAAVLLPGSRYGGKYVLYPGDPLRYHSHLIVKEPILSSCGNTNHIDLLELICDGRLSTNVKKCIVIPIVSGESDETKKTSFYSIEWSGFG